MGVRGKMIPTLSQPAGSARVVHRFFTSDAAKMARFAGSGALAIGTSPPNVWYYTSAGGIFFSSGFFAPDL
jgi:hypothetical protein